MGMINRSTQTIQKQVLINEKHQLFP